MTSRGKRGLKRKIVSALELPKEIVLDLPSAHLMGDEEISVTNHKGIAAYASETVRIKTAIGMMQISGRGLVLKQICRDSIVVTGEILEVAVQRGQRR